MAGFAFDATVLGLIICLCYFSDGSGRTFLGSDYGLQKVSVYFFECDDWDRGSHTLIYVFFLQSTSGRIVDKVRDIPFLLYPIHLFYKIAVEPFSTEAILGLLAWIGLTFFLLYLSKKKVFPRFYDVILLNSEEKVKKERRSKEGILTTKKGFFRMALRCHLSLLGQGTGVITVLFTSAFLPYLMMISLISKIRDSQIVPDIHPPYWLPLFFVAISQVYLQSGYLWRGKIFIFLKVCPLILPAI